MPPFPHPVQLAASTSRDPFLPLAAQLGGLRLRLGSSAPNRSDLASVLTQTEGTGSLPIVARMSRAGLVQTKGFGVFVVLIEVSVEGCPKVDDGAEDTASDAPSGQGREEIFDGVEPGA